MTKRKHVSFVFAEPRLVPGDVLSYRLAPFWDNPLSWLICKPIAIAGRGPDVHTAMIDDDQSGCLIALGMRLGRQKLKKLRDEVAENPGLIDVYRLDPVEQPETLQAICNEMRCFALANHYGVLNVIRSGLYVFPFTRWLVPLDEKLDGDDTRPFCTQAVCESIRRHAAPLFRNNVRPPRHTYPADAPASPRLKYVMTLDP